MLTYQDLEAALKRVPLEQLPAVYESILAHAEWPYEASPAAMEADDRAWEQRFAAEASQRFFERMAAEVRAEMVGGETEPLEQLLAEDEANDGIQDDAPVQTTVSPTPCGSEASGAQSLSSLAAQPPPPRFAVQAGGRA